MIIDTDLDYDDMMGLLYAMVSPCVDLKLVTVCNSGFALPAYSIQLARAVLESVHNNSVPLGENPYGSVPVGNGSFGSSAPVASFPEAWRWQAVDYMGSVLGYNRSAPASRLDAAAPSATAALKAVLASSHEPVDYVLLGPWTNLAEALEDEELRELFRVRVRRLVASGGGFRGGGNVEASGLVPAPGFTDDVFNGLAECNIFLDAPAADFVLRESARLGVRVFFMSLDATSHAPITLADVESRAKRIAPGGYLETLVGIVRGFSATMPANSTPMYWDALAVVYDAGSPHRICNDSLPLKDVRVETRLAAPSPGSRRQGPVDHTDPRLYGALKWSRDERGAASAWRQHDAGDWWPAALEAAACMRVDEKPFLVDFWGAFWGGEVPKAS